MHSKLGAYYKLTKPGIIYGNVLTLLGGYFFGAKGSVDIPTLLGVVGGTALVIACGCVVNNYLDRDIDLHMRRTKKRSLVTGAISGRTALPFAAVLGSAGFLLLVVFTNTLTTILGSIGLVSYALLYTYLKRHSVHGTLLGTIPGALPPMAGYTAATNSLDATAWILFAILVLWQMVHFYAISLYRLKEYQKAKIPVMPAVHGVRSTVAQMNLYGLGYIVAIVALTVYSYAGLSYLLVMLIVSAWWLWVVAKGPRVRQHASWARLVFLRSLVILPVLSFMLAINVWLP